MQKSAYLNMEQPYGGRAIINDFYNGMDITIPAKKSWFVIVFLCFWLCGWLAGEIMAPTFFFRSGHNGPPDLFSLIWICGWTAGGAFCAATLWWNLAGKEIINVSAGVLTITKKGTIAPTKSYDLNEARNFRAWEEPDNGFGSGNRQGLVTPWNVANSGTIKFDYGMQTVKFGDRLYQAEGEYILQRLANKKLINLT